MLHDIRGARHRAHTSDSGDTLLEVVISTAVVGIAAVALIGAILTSITASSEHRSLTVDNAVLKSYANAAVQQIQRQASANWTSCASSYTVTPPANMPSDYTVALSSAQYWSASGNSGSWSGNCPGATAPQLFTVTVTSPTQVSTSISFVIRKPT